MEIENLESAFAEHALAVKNGLGKFSTRIDGIEKALKETNAIATEAATKANRPNYGGAAEDVTKSQAWAEAQKLLRSDAQIVLEQKADLLSGSDPSGGYAVVSALSSRLTSRIHEISPVRPYARIEVIATDAFEEVSDGQEAAYGWVGETSSRPTTDAPQIGKLRIPVGEIYAMPRATQTIIDDSAFDIAGWLTRKVADKFARVESAAFLTGDGVGKPRGLLTYSGSTEADTDRDWNTVQYLNSGSSSGFLSPTTSVSPSDILVDLTYSMKPSHRQNARWFMNSQTAGVVRKMKDADGRPLWVDSIAAGTPPLLLGFPVVNWEDMPAIAQNEFPIAFADLQSAYAIIDRLNLRIQVDPFTSRPYVNFYATKRVGGGLTNSDAVKLLRVST